MDHKRVKHDKHDKRLSCIYFMGGENQLLNKLGQLLAWLNKPLNPQFHFPGERSVKSYRSQRGSYILIIGGPYSQKGWGWAHVIYVMPTVQHE